jgi:hypothetical protein
MQRQPVESSTLQSVGYDSERHVLEVEFENGSVYHYFLVPRSIYRGLMAAESKGRFLNAKIKDVYRSQRL